MAEVGLSHVITKLFLSTSGIIVCAGCAYFVEKKLTKLHQTIKWQLLGMVIHHLVAYLNVLGTQVTKYIFGKFTKGVCTYGLIWGTSLFSGCQVFSSAISLSRFYMTWSTRKMKFPKTWIMASSTISAIGFDLALNTLVYLSQAYFELPGVVEACAGFESGGNNVKTGWILLLWIAFASGLGVAGDLGLAKYLRSSSHQGGEIQLVPWKSSTDHQDQEFNKDTVPMRATLITFLTTFLFTGAVIMVLTTVGSADLVVTLMLAYGCVQVPLIIGLTVKLNSKKVGPAQPEQKLHFHEGDDEDEESC